MVDNTKPHNKNTILNQSVFTIIDPNIPDNKTAIETQTQNLQQRTTIETIAAEALLKEERLETRSLIALDINNIPSSDVELVKEAVRAKEAFAQKLKNQGFFLPILPILLPVLHAFQIRKKAVPEQIQILLLDILVAESHKINPKDLEELIQNDN